jgi:hypothetical protein
MTEYKAACACGHVELTLTGRPVIIPNCCCNDCVTAAYYVDKKAKQNGKHNTSNFEPNNTQSTVQVMWPPSGILLVKGKEVRCNVIIKLLNNHYLRK